MTDQRDDDPYVSPPPGWQPPPNPPPPAYGAPPPPVYGAPQQPSPYDVPAGQYGAPTGWPQQQTYGAPPYAPYGQHAMHYGPGYPPPTKTNGFAIASLIVSIVLFVIFGLGSVLGVVFGIIGMRQTRRKNEKGHGLALAGVIVGAVGVVFWLIALIAVLTVGGSPDSGGTSGNLGTMAPHVLLIR